MFKDFDKSIEMYEQYLNKKHWADLTREQIELISDEIKRKEYLKKYNNCLCSLIAPLTWHIDNKSRFNFSHSDRELTCNNMMRDLYNYYNKRGFEKVDLCKIAADKDIRKKY